MGGWFHAPKGNVGKQKDITTECRQHGEPPENPKEVLEAIPEIIKKNCKRCGAFMRALDTPKLRATLAMFFNHRVQGDLFTLFGREFFLLIDELFRYKQGEVI